MINSPSADGMTCVCVCVCVCMCVCACACVCVCVCVCVLCVCVGMVPRFETERMKDKYCKGQYKLSNFPFTKHNKNNQLTFYLLVKTCNEKKTALRERMRSQQQSQKEREQGQKP